MLKFKITNIAEINPNCYSWFNNNNIVGLINDCLFVCYDRPWKTEIKCRETVLQKISEVRAQVWKLCNYIDKIRFWKGKEKTLNINRDKFCSQICVQLWICQICDEINAFEMCRKIASGSYCTIQRQCLRLIEDGRVHWAGLILPSEHLWISAGSGILCSKISVLGVDQDEKCLLWPVKSCGRIVCRLTVSLKKSVL